MLLAGRGDDDLIQMRDVITAGTLATESIEQRLLFNDTLVLVAGKAHPLASRTEATLRELAAYPWVVARQGTPARRHFDELFAPLGEDAPKSIVESGSVILMRELLDASEHLGCISCLQAEAEIARGLLHALPVDMARTSRAIGLTVRKGWLPTAAQRQFIELLGPSPAAQNT